MNPNPGRAGFTLVEALGALALLTLLIGFLHAILGLSVAAGSDGMRRGRVQVGAQRALGRIRRDLRRSLPGTLVITDENGSSRIDYDIATGMNADGTVRVAAVSLRWEPGTRDDDGDGVADDGPITRTVDGRSWVMCHGVARGGFTATRTGDSIAITFDLVTSSESGAPIRSSMDGEVTLRN